MNMGEIVFLKSNRVRIVGVGSAVPRTVVSNTEIISHLQTSDLWIKTNLGIHERRICRFEDETSSQLGAKAAIRALEYAGVDPKEVQGIIVATATPEQKAPSTACLIQNILGITNGCFAFDIQAVCSGFIYGLTVAAGLIKSTGVTNILLIGVDTFSKITDWDDRSSPFFGDGAGAVLIRHDSNEEGEFTAIIKADGSGHEGFFVAPNDTHYTMNPHAVYEAATRVLPGVIKELLDRSGKKIDDVKYIVPHQPSIRVLDKMAESIDVSKDMVLKNMDRFANTAGASIPLLLAENVVNGTINNGDLILMAGVGSGWTWGAALYRWKN
jgi:3-oxoacyl-[acyl-carrier-protein] synthase-3